MLSAWPWSVDWGSPSHACPVTTPGGPRNSADPQAQHANPPGRSAAAAQCAPWERGRNVAIGHSRKYIANTLTQKFHCNISDIFNPFMPIAAKTYFSSISQPKAILKIFSRRSVNQNSVYNSPSNNFQIYASFQGYFKKYDRTSRLSSSTSPGLNGLDLFGKWRETKSFNADHSVDCYPLGTKQFYVIHFLGVYK